MFPEAPLLNELGQFLPKYCTHGQIPATKKNLGSRQDLIFPFSDPVPKAFKYKETALVGGVATPRSHSAPPPQDSQEELWARAQKAG